MSAGRPWTSRRPDDEPGCRWPRHRAREGTTYLQQRQPVRHQAEAPNEAGKAAGVAAAARKAMQFTPTALK